MEVEEDEMTKQLTVSEILSNLYNSAWIEGSNYKENNPEGGNIPSKREVAKIATTKQSLKALVTEMVNEIIGDDDDSVRNPSTGELDIHSVWRNNFRTEMRQRAKAEIERRFL
jgi:hypothetical protein